MKPAPHVVVSKQKTAWPSAAAGGQRAAAVIVTHTYLLFSAIIQVGSGHWFFFSADLPRYNDENETLQ